MAWNVSVGSKNSLETDRVFWGSPNPWNFRHKVPLGLRIPITWRFLFLTMSIHRVVPANMEEEMSLEVGMRVWMKGVTSLFCCTSEKMICWCVLYKKDPPTFFTYRCQECSYWQVQEKVLIILGPSFWGTLKWVVARNGNSQTYPFDHPNLHLSS